MPLIEISLEFFLTKLQNVLLIAILIFLGRTFQKRKARDELCRVVCSEKNADSDLQLPKAKKKSGFWFPLFQCVSAQTLKHGSDHSTIGETRVSGFGLKCIGILQRDISANCPFFTSVSGDTSEKKNRGVFWSRTFPCVSGQTRKPRGGPIVN